MDEQFYDSNNSYETPSQEIPVYTPPTPKKREKKNRMGLRICALALVFALLGGALGAGGVIWYESSRGQTGTTSKNETAMLQGIRENSVLNTVTVDTGKEMTAAEVYAANVNSTVGITTSITTNYWGFQTTSAAAGSGFILTEDGYILTNYHVVENSNSITVAMYNGDTYDATLIGYDESNDVAVLKVDAEGLSPVVLGDSDNLNVGDSVHDFVGPLGRATEVEGLKKVCVVGGGVGCAIALPIARELHEQGCVVHSVVGFRNKDLLILEDEFRACSDELRIMTDDGSYGTKGVVTAALDELVAAGNQYDLVITIGPLIMMKFVVKTCQKHGLKSIVSMNPIMIDGTGMCGGCRLTVGGQTKFACVDGPDFDGDLVDFDEAMARGTMYRPFEAHAREAACNLFKTQEGM